jgi:hypothetical protein
MTITYILVISIYSALLFTIVILGGYRSSSIIRLIRESLLDIREISYTIS